MRKPFTATAAALAAMSLMFITPPDVPGRTADKERPIRDDVGFCWKPASMKLLVEHLERTEKDGFPGEGLVAAISPHDDYLYAGRVYYPLFKALRTGEVVIFGVTHGTVRKETGDRRGVIILDGYDLWPGLLKPIGVSPLREEIMKALDPRYFIVDDKAQALEHSIEALLPFLQYFNPEVRITPIMVTAMPYERMEEVSDRLAEVISSYIRSKGLELGRDIAFLISADGNHYGKDFGNAPYGEDEKAWETARSADRRIIDTCLTGPLDGSRVKSLTGELWGATYADYGGSSWCGKYSIPFGLLTAGKVVERVAGKRLNGRLFRYSDTYSEGVLPLVGTGMGTTAPFSLKHWVSFCSIGYYLR